MSGDLNIFGGSKSPLPQPGDTVTKFSILSQIGEGGMAKVFLAKDTTLGRDVALKFPDFEDELAPAAEVRDKRQRFIREAQVMARVSHPNIVRIYEAVLEAECPFFAMEYVQGITLGDRMRSKPSLSFLEVTGIALQMVQALRFAWEHFHIIHRDLKPANIMLGLNDQVKILDMGLAKVMDDGASTQFSTASGGNPGTPAYMSPEQLTGEKDLDNRVDIFAIGVMLCELYTFRNPFPGNNVMQILHAKMRGIDFKIEDYAPGLPTETAELIYRMLVCDRAERVDSYAEIEQVLTTVQEELMDRSHQAKDRRKMTLGKKDEPDPGTVDLPRDVKTILVDDLKDDEKEDEVVVRQPLPPTIVSTDASENPPLAGPHWCFLPGAKVGDYTLEQLIGRGSFGSVYRATAPNDETVAIKFLDLPAMEEAQQRFADGCAKLQTLEDRSVCKLRTYGSEGKYYYLVSDYVHYPDTSCNLHHYRNLFGEQVSERYALKVGHMMLDALIEAHEKGVVHGNLKPTNILFEHVGMEGEYMRLHMRMTDFGLVSMVGADVLQERLSGLDPNSTEATATLSETMLYASPEQMDGADPSVPGDLYTVGMLLFYFLTGHSALDKTKRVTDYRPDIDETWDPILSKVMREDPDRRFKSAREFHEVLALVD